MDRDYRVLVDGETIDSGWTSNLENVLKKAENMRLIFFEGEVVVIEISPWYWEKGIAYCTGCHYSICPVVRRQEFQSIARR